MCLSTLNEGVATKYKRRKTGWKTFCRGQSGALYPIIQGNGKPLPVGVWLKEADFRISSDIRREQIMVPCGQGYPFGFHVSLTKEGAEEWAGSVVKVEFRNPVAWGTQEGFPVVVAEEMYIRK